MPYSERFAFALGYAAQLHRHQRRKGTNIPYISHLLAVAALVVENGGTEDEAIAALLHDAIEDQGGEPVRRQIAAMFGPGVEEIVVALSDSVTEDPEIKAPWKQRKIDHLRHLSEHATQSQLLVCCADKLHNARCTLADLREIGPKTFDRFNASREETIWYYRSLVKIFAERLPGRLSSHLTETIDAMEAV